LPAGSFPTRLRQYGLSTSASILPQDAVGAANGHPRVLMLGMGWFPSTVGGLDRYYRALFEQLPEASGVVIGPAEGAPATIAAASRHDLPLPRRLGSFWLAARRAARGAEVVDAHFALYAAAPLLLGPRRRPTVFHFHGPWADENAAAGDSSRMKRALRATLERGVLRRADAHVVLSSAFRRVLVERHRVAPWKINVWAPGVALERFTPGDRSAARARLGIDPAAFVVVCARRMVARMGIDLLLDAWSQIEHELPEGSLLLLIGDGPLHETFAARAAQPALAGRVRVTGRLSDEELIEAYRCADVAAVPSVAVEGFGLVVLEAAACGTPSIVSDVGGLPEAAAALDPSLVVTAGDIEALGARLRAAAQGALPTRAATRDYAERFAWPAVAERHRAMHRRLVAGSRERELRVVYLDHVARLSGGEIALLRLLPHLRRVNAHVILGEEGPLVARLAQAGISVEVLPIAAAARDVRKDTVRLGGASPAALLSTVAYVARLTLRLRQLRPDLVHTNSLKAGVYGSLAANAAGIPVVWHLRDRIAPDYLPRPAVRFVRGLVGRVADGVIANSATTLATLDAPGRSRLLAAGARDLSSGYRTIPDMSMPSGHRSTLGAPTARASRRVRRVIPDSVEPSPYPRTPEAPATPAPTFGIVGRIAPWKGQDLFVRAFAAAFPDPGAERAVIVGAPLFGEEACEHDLRELIARLGLTERVQMRGFREDVWSELARIDVLVHASTIPEPFGQVVLEGMAASLPVIAPDEGGPAEVIVDGETGRLFAARSVDALAAAMRALSADPQARERLGSAARRSIVAYHPECVGEQLEEVYEQVLQCTGTSAQRPAASRA
jgi:glycosyltransferase involved in cell wall biosynthesis